MATSRRSGERRQTERSGDYSSDPRFDPEARFEVITAAKSANDILRAMRRFVEEESGDQFAEAVAVYVRSARARGDAVEHVLANLNAVADRFQKKTVGSVSDPGSLYQPLMRGLLLAFYGDANGRRSRTRRRG